MLITRKAELRKRPQQARSSFTFDAILDAAERIAVTEGLKALQMSALGRRAGVSAGSLYQYFPDRRSILQALSERSSTRFLADLKVRCEALRDTELDGFLSLLSAGLSEMAAREHRLSTVLREELEKGDPLGEVRDLTEEAADALAMALRAPLARRGRPGWSEEQLSRQCRLMMWTADGLLEGALRQPQGLTTDLAVALRSAWRGILGLEPEGPLSGGEMRGVRA